LTEEEATRAPTAIANFILGGKFLRITEKEELNGGCYSSI
jgi:hypothetical protein